MLIRIPKFLAIKFSAAPTIVAKLFLALLVWLIVAVESDAGKFARSFIEKNRIIFCLNKLILGKK